MDRSLREAAVVLFPLLAAASSCSKSSESRGASRTRPNVLIVSIDTLRADHLGCYGYAPYAEPVSPRLDQFAKEALVFERCFAPRGQTGPSLTSMATGCYPSRHGVLDNFQPLKAGIPSLARELAAAGYETRAFLSFFPIPKASKAALAFERVDEARPRMPQEPQARWDDATEQEFARFVRTRKPGERPFFAWVHFYDVHQPYAARAPFGSSFAADYRGRLALRDRASETEFDAVVKKALDQQMLARSPPDREEQKYVVALYDAGIAATDARVGDLLALVSESGLDPETIVVVTADHGEELAEHNGFWFHGNSVYDSVLHIPLIVRGPGVMSGRYGELAQNVDLLPTLLDFVGLPVPKGIDGISFAAELRGARTDAYRRRIAWSEWQHLILGARSDKWKYILNPRGAHPKKTPYDQEPDGGGCFVDCHELYDVAADPHETRNVWLDQKDELEELRQLVGEEYARRFRDLAPAGTEPVEDPRERERLESLGYPAGRPEDYVLDPHSCDDD